MILRWHGFAETLTKNNENSNVIADWSMRRLRATRQCMGALQWRILNVAETLRVGSSAPRAIPLHRGRRRPKDENTRGWQESWRGRLTSRLGAEGLIDSERRIEPGSGAATRL